MSEADVVAAGVVGLVRAFQQGALTPTDAARAYVSRIRRYDGKLNAYRVPASDLADEAAASTRRWRAGLPKGPLDGVPIAVKSNIAVRGLPHDAGIGAFRNRPAEADAEAVRRLRASGALILGTLNMEEGALGAKTDNPWFGPTFNPWREGYTPGGSSGGSGAAVAAGLCAAALGTDTMGSVRIPASYCGVTGLKPPRGAVPDEGLVPLSPTLDTIGPLARSVADVGAVYGMIAGEAVQAPGAVTVKVAAALASSAALAATERAADALRQSGLDVGPAALPDDLFGPVRRAGLLVTEAEGHAALGAAMAADPDGFSAFLTKMLTYGATAPQERVEAARAALAAAEDAFARSGADVLLLPTTPTPAFAMNEDHADQADLTAFANAAGLAAVSVPFGLADGLPVGVQAVGRTVGAVLAVAARIEAAAPPLGLPPGYEPEKSGGRFARKAS